MVNDDTTSILGWLLIYIRGYLVCIATLAAIITFARLIWIPALAISNLLFSF